jgi:intracellular septation protein A
MALAVFFLLFGILATEAAIFGIRGAGVAGALLLAASALVLVFRWSQQRSLKSGPGLPIH